jgi:hypothetical protein
MHTARFFAERYTHCGFRLPAVILADLWEVRKIRGFSTFPLLTKSGYQCTMSHIRLHRCRSQRENRKRRNTGYMDFVHVTFFVARETLEFAGFFGCFRRVHRPKNRACNLFTPFFPFKRLHRLRSLLPPADAAQSALHFSRRRTPPSLLVVNFSYSFKY